MEEAQPVLLDHVTVLLREGLTMTIVPLIGATLNLEELFALPSPTLSEDASETYIKLDLPQEVSKKRDTRPPSARYKKNYIAKNIDSPLPGTGGAKSSEQRNDITSKFYTVLAKQAQRIRNNYFHKLNKELDDETFHQHLWEYVDEARKILEIEWTVAGDYDLAMNGESSTKMWLNDENIDRKIRNAMANTAETWDEKKLPTLHEASRRGGLANKFENVSAYLETLGMSHAAAGRVLGWDYRTVKAMRAHFEPMTEEQLLALVEQEDSPHGYQLPQSHPGIKEASHLRSELGREAEPRPLGLAHHEHARSHGQTRNLGGSSGQPEEYAVDDYRGAIYRGKVPF